MIVLRTCTEISARNEEQYQEKKSRPLEAFRDVPAYVLLGDPGAGKTTAFEAECEALGEDACLITARDFLTFEPQSHPEWQDKTLFIDGLDEIRVGANDTRTPFNQIRRRLDALGKPHFRLSCREADWLGANDQKHLESVSPDSKVMVLRLNPLTDSDIADILNDRPDIGDAQAFIALAKDRGVDGLLANPQTLNMLADVVAQGRGWPDSRKKTFDMACGQMVREHNEEHQAAQASNSPSTPAQLLDAAGRLCAVQLISGAAGYTNTLRGQPSEGYPTLDQCDYDSTEMLRLALATKLFKSASDNRFAPIHRHIAEFLGARHLAQVIKSGLPARRVTALIVGEDGTVVTEMRGLSAWLAAHCKDARADLIERDPIGVGLYGDIREFSTDENRALLKCLNREASRLDSAFLRPTAFGALATPDMESVLGEILKDSARDKDHQIFIGFILNVLSESSPLPNLSEILLEIVRDDTWWPSIDISALGAFIKNCPDSQDKTNMLKALLADIQNGSVSGPNTQYFESLIAQQLESAAPDPISRSVSEDLSLEAPQEHARENERITAIDIERLRPSWATPSKSLAKKQEQEEWLNRVWSNKIALCENRATLDLLYRIGFEYFGFFYDFNGDKGLKSIEKWLLGDHGLINAALEGLRGTINREEVPDAEEILGLKEKGRTHYLGLPFLAGLAEVERTTPEDSSQWDDDQIRTALAFYYSTPHADYRPKWYQRLLVSRPEIVAEVQVQSAVSEFRSGREHIYKLWELAHDPNHSQVAKYASLPLLHTFPARCKLNQIENLNHLLWATLQYTDRSSLQELIKKKLSRKSMNDAQRVYWLAAGIIVSPGTYNDLLRDFVRGREGRILHLTAFFCPQTSALFSSFGESRIAYELGIPGLELLIYLVGSYVGSDKWKEGGLVTPAQQASRLVNDLIQRLAASPTKDATDALDRLLADPALSRWRDVLSQAQDVQRVTWRDASYRHPTIKQVCQTLNSGPPANPGDLAALVTDHLDKIARKIRSGPTSDWRQYWNVDQYNRPTCEKPEDACRDNLLSDLQNRLEQLDIDAQPEGRYTNDKRSDIRVYFGGSNVPGEIKKNSHQKLWSALRDQLIAKYTSTPETDGYGIYLVFWFGKDRTQPPPSGTRPANAKELKERLEATLSPDEARKISVCVIDVSRPD